MIFLLILSFISALVFASIFIVSRVRKKPAKKTGRLLISSVAVSIIFFILVGVLVSPDEPVADNSHEQILQIEQSYIYAPIVQLTQDDEYELAQSYEYYATPGYTVYTELLQEYELTLTEVEQATPNNSGLDKAVVRRVIDGDTIVLYNGERVRFIGIDAPEIGEPGADEATQFVRDMVEGQTVWLEASGNDRDRFNRLRRYVWVQEPTDTQCENQIQEKQLNAMLLANGLAVPFVASGNQQTQTAITTQEPASTDARFIGNVNTSVFHGLGCSTLPAPQNRIYFYTRADAVNAGHRPCGRCNP